MENEKHTVQEDDLEIVEIAEFKRSDGYQQVSRQKEWEEDRRLKLYGIAALFAIGVLAEVLLGIFAFHLPATLVLIVLALEAAAAVLLYDMRIWVQVAEVVIGLIAGIVFGRLALMILGAIVFMGALLAFYGAKHL